MVVAIQQLVPLSLLYFEFPASRESESTKHMPKVRKSFLCCISHCGRFFFSSEDYDLLNLLAASLNDQPSWNVRSGMTQSYASGTHRQADMHFPVRYRSVKSRFKQRQALAQQPGSSTVLYNILIR